MPRDPTFEVVESGDAQPGRQLIFGVSHLGMAGVSAADYLVRQFDVEEVGHVATAGFPAISPFENGEPRHPMRLYAGEALDATVFVGESFVPVWAAEAFVDGLLDWIADAGVVELASRMEALNQGEQSMGSRDYPEDRMFM